MQYKPNRLFHVEKLAVLAGVLDQAVRSVIAFEGASLNETERLDIGARIGTIIMDAYLAGETDPEVLKMIAVRSALKG